MSIWGNKSFVTFGNKLDNKNYFKEYNPYVFNKHKLSK